MTAMPAVKLSESFGCIEFSLIDRIEPEVSGWTRAEATLFEPAP
jgi:hypothetical protein